MEQKCPFASSVYQMLISILFSTVQKSWYDLREVGGVTGAVRGTADYRGDYWTAIGWRDGQFCYYVQTENIQALRASCTGRVHCANVLVKDSSNSSLATISCACGSIDFLTEITSRSVDSIRGYRRMCVCACVRRGPHILLVYDSFSQPSGKIIPWKEYRPVARPQPTHDVT